MQIKAYGTSCLIRTKPVLSAAEGTDKADAKLIAGFCAECNPAPWQAPSEAELTLRALALRLDALQTMRTQESNRLDVSLDAVRNNIQ